MARAQFATTHVSQTLEDFYVSTCICRGPHLRQVADFCTEVVGTDQDVTLVGNSIGCIACMSAGALLPNLRGLCLLNSAGNLDVEEEVRSARPLDRPS